MEYLGTDSPTFKGVKEEINLEELKKKVKCLKAMKETKNLLIFLNSFFENKNIKFFFETFELEYFDDIEFDFHPADQEFARGFKKLIHDIAIVINELRDPKITNFVFNNISLKLLIKNLIELDKEYWLNVKRDELNLLENWIMLSGKIKLHELELDKYLAYYAFNVDLYNNQKLYKSLKKIFKRDREINFFNMLVSKDLSGKVNTI